MSQEDCVFCRIAESENDADIVYRDDEITAFWDRRPAAPVHILFIPNRHIESINEVESGDAELLGKMILLAKKVAEEQGVAESGYRLFFNTGPEGGQTIFHLHLHLMGGRRLPIYRG